MTIISTRPESWTSPFAITIQERSSSVTRVAFIPILQASPRAAQDVSRRRRVRDGCYTRSREPARSPPRAHGGRHQRAVPARRARVRRGPPHERGDRRPRPRPGQRPHRRPRAAPPGGAPDRDAAPGLGPGHPGGGGAAARGRGRRRDRPQHGCPVAKIVAKGQGAALMRDPLTVAVILRALRKAVGGPLTIKIRGGWDDRRVNAVEIARLAEGEGVDAITVHPRTRSQQFAGLAPWEIIASVVDAVAIPVTGNGDVRSHDDARAMVRATGCAAVMIGRGALGAPWIFTPGAVSRAEKAQIIRRHARLIEAHLESRTALVQLKKHLAWYANGLPFAARIRAELFAAPSAAAVRDAFWRLW